MNTIFNLIKNTLPTFKEVCLEPEKQTGPYAVIESDKISTDYTTGGTVATGEFTLLVFAKVKSEGQAKVTALEGILNASNDVLLESTALDFNPDNLNYVFSMIIKTIDN